MRAEHRLLDCGISLGYRLLMGDDPLPPRPRLGSISLLSATFSPLLPERRPGALVKNVDTRHYSWLTDPS